MQEDTRVDAKHPSKPYSGELEWDIRAKGRWISSRFKFGQSRPKLGLGDKQEPKAPLGVDQNVERDIDSVMTDRGNGENHPITEKRQCRGKRPNGSKAIGIGVQIWAPLTG